MEISGATVLVTGATGGIGQALVEALGRRGAKLVLTGRRADVLAEVADPLGARSVVADLGEPGDVERLVAEAGDVDILVANAALPTSGDLRDYTTAQIDRAVAVNLRAPIVLSRLLVPAMVEAGRGHIVHIGSLSGRVASPVTSLYNATKFGLRGFALGLRQDLHGTGVGVSIVEPGFVREAGMFADSGVKLPPGTRTVSPARVAKAVVRAIERDRAEITVAPVELRLAGALGLVFPSIAARVQRLGARTAHDLAEAQRDKR
jgi:short-subunit dehydrogenase